MSQGCRPGLEKFETLQQHDAGLVRLRRMPAQEARKQIKALRAAGLSGND